MAIAGRTPMFERGVGAALLWVFVPVTAPLIRTVPLMLIPLIRPAPSVARMMQVPAPLV